MSDSASSPEISIVIPAWNEAENIGPLVEDIARAMGSRPFEAIIVDDGSRDGTFAAVGEAHRADPRFRGVRLSRHSGKAAAYSAGFRHARGTVIATMDADLQDDPADIGKLEDKLAQGYDLVVGWKQTGKSSPATFILSRLGNRLLRISTGLGLHDMNCPLRAMKAPVARRLNLRADLHRYIPILARSEGFTVAEAPVSNRPRLHGKSKYTGGKYWSSATAYMGLRLYLRFGERPMHLFGGLGLACFLFGAAVIAYVVLSFLIWNTDIDDDLPTLILGVLMALTGTQFLGLGLLGEILVRRLRFVEDRDGGEEAEVLGP